MFARFSNMFGYKQDDEAEARSPTHSDCSSNSTHRSGSMCYSHGEPCKIDNSKCVLQKIATLYAERLMSDILLVVGSQEFAAHRLILCASSDVFQVMLMNPEWCESREQRIVLKEAPECEEVFELFLKYLYTGQLKVTHVTVLPILALADKYNVKDLISTCGAYMKEHIVSASKQSCLISWLQYNVTCGHQDIAEACMNHLKWNFSQVMHMKDFVTCDVNLLMYILSQHDLVVKDEMAVYNTVVYWLHQQEKRLQLSVGLSSDPLSSTLAVPSLTESSNPLVIWKNNSDMSTACSRSVDLSDHLELLTYEVMKYVRFPMMSPRQLADLLLDSLTNKHKEFFITRMAIGMSFHSGQWERVQEVMCDADRANHLLFTPRLYTAEQWSAGLSVDNLPDLPYYHTRTLVFSTPASASEMENESQLEWIVELYPKGVWFKKFFLIVWQGTVEVPEVILKTVRLAITAKGVERARVRIAVLVYAVQDGIEYVISAVTMRHIFTAQENLLNWDDILSYEKLKDPVEGKKYLLDPSNSLHIQVIISPLEDPKLGLYT